MHFDAITLACLTHEFRETLRFGRVQQVLQVDEQSLGFEIYARRVRHYLLFSTASEAQRTHLCTQKLRRGTDQQPPLLLLLRKYARGAIVDQITQADPTERIIHFGFDHPQHGVTTLVAELIGRNSNLLLLGPGERILGCMKRVHATKNKNERIVQPGRIYRPPRPQQKLSPFDHDKFDYAQLTQNLQAGKLLTKQLIATFAGVSPTIAREIAWRATGSITTPVDKADPAAVASTLQEIWSPLSSGNWNPGQLYCNEIPVGFSAYPAKQTEADSHSEWKPTASMSAAVETFVAQKAQAKAITQQAPAITVASTEPVGTTEDAIDTYAALRRTIGAEVQKARKRLTRQLAALASDEPKPGEPEELRTKAEWLLALNSQIQEGQKSLDIDLGDRLLQIPLDPQRPAIEQAERMFKRASKLERAAKFIPQRRVTLQNDLAFLDQLTADLALAENQPELIAVREELLRARLLPIGRGKQKKPQQRADRSAAQPLRFVSPDGLAILVGRNARQNEKVTFDLAKADDLWLHARGTPGAHVVVRSGGQKVSDETLRTAAQLAAYYSGHRGELVAEVSYTARKYVTRMPGGRTGQVFIRNEKSIAVHAELPESVLPNPRT